MSTRKIKDAVDLDTKEKVFYRGYAGATYLSDGRTVESAIMARNGMSIIDHGVSDTTFELTPNVVHKWGVVQSLTLTLPEDPKEKENQYRISFTAGANFSLTLPLAIQWENGEIPVFEGGKTYEISISGKRAIYAMFSLPVAYVGDVAYKTANGRIMVVNPDEWDASLGTPIGVVAVPSGFAPNNGKARIISLNWADANGASTATASMITWSEVSSESSLPNFTAVPTTDNASAALSGSNMKGYLPSDKFTGTASYVDPVAAYYDTSIMIPSPYLGDIPNPAYYAEISGGNALADFDGKGNTTVLAAESNGVPPVAMSKYKAVGAEEIEWYLPAAGELGYMMVRYSKINAALAKVGAAQLGADYRYWASTEYGAGFMATINASNSYINFAGKQYKYYARPFTQLDF